MSTWQATRDASTGCWTSPDVGSAQTLAKRIVDGKLTDHFTARDVHRKNWSRLRSMREVEAALALLEEFGHIRGFEQNDGLGRPTTRYAINPKSKRKP